MSIQAIATFVDTPYGRYQNGKVGSSINGYSYLSFIYQGATKSRSGDNLQAALVLANNPVAMNIANQLVGNFATVTVENWLMDPLTYFRSKLLTSETWLVSSFSYDPEAVDLVLSSSLDAIGTQAPTRVLTRKLVGALPTTGAVQNL
tara:strand:- start:486 stop:926 length:441 start_codon:yes stop_codon:yes gene_type:complete